MSSRRNAMLCFNDQQRCGLLPDVTPTAKECIGHFSSSFILHIALFAIIAGSTIPSYPADDNSPLPGVIWITTPASFPSDAALRTAPADQPVNSAQIRHMDTGPQSLASPTGGPAAVRSVAESLPADSLPDEIITQSLTVIGTVQAEPAPVWQKPRNRSTTHALSEVHPRHIADTQFPAREKTASSDIESRAVTPVPPADMHEVTADGPPPDQEKSGHRAPPPGPASELQSLSGQREPEPDRAVVITPVNQPASDAAAQPVQTAQLKETMSGSSENFHHDASHRLAAVSMTRQLSSEPPRAGSFRGTVTTPATTGSKSVTEEADTHRPAAEEYKTGTLRGSSKGDITLTVEGAAGFITIVTMKEFVPGRRGRPFSKSETRRAVDVKPLQSSRERNIIDIIIEKAVPAVYTMIIDPGRERAEFRMTLKLYDGTPRARIRKYGLRTVTGKTVICRILMPEGILWDDDLNFTGSIEDSESVTKFISSSGLVWKEYRD